MKLSDADRELVISTLLSAALDTRRAAAESPIETIRQVMRRKAGRLESIAFRIDKGAA